MIDLEVPNVSPQTYDLIARLRPWMDPNATPDALLIHAINDAAQRLATLDCAAQLLMQVLDTIPATEGRVPFEPEAYQARVAASVAAVFARDLVFGSGRTSLVHDFSTTE